MLSQSSQKKGTQCDSWHAPFERPSSPRLVHCPRSTVYWSQNFRFCFARALRNALPVALQQWILRLTRFVASPSISFKKTFSTLGAARRKLSIEDVCSFSMEDLANSLGGTDFTVLPLWWPTLISLKPCRAASQVVGALHLIVSHFRIPSQLIPEAVGFFERRFFLLIELLLLKTRVAANVERVRHCLCFYACAGRWQYLTAGISSQLPSQSYMHRHDFAPCSRRSQA
jgi:hypothetical protein